MTEAAFLRSTRDSYDLVADQLADAWRDEMDAKPYDRAMLSAFAELIRADGNGPVTDAGCGAGRITGWLHKAGLAIDGVDLSPGMLAAARRDYPDLRFAEGDMLHLDLPDASRAAIVAWYSIIHLPRERVPDAFAEFRRVLKPGGYLQLAFQVGDDDGHRGEAFGQAIDLSFRRHRPEVVTQQLAAAGLPVRACLTREPRPPEGVPQAFILARKPE
jgi:ubiquinone/menaquinone biosynthesis C-methylase UbiE